MAYRTIVVGTDGSPTAALAVGAAARLARRCRARFVAISAVRAEGFSERAAREALTAAAEEARVARVEVAAELDRSSPAEALLDAALRHEADAIVVGNRGMGGAPRFRLGTVPDRVAHEAPCDLLIVDTTGRPGGPPRPGPPYRRVVVGTDGSPTATEAAQRAFDLAALFGASAVLVHVGDPVLGAIRLERTAALAPDEVEVARLALEGDPADRICEVAEREEADLVVVGNKGMAGVRRFLGSVPNKVAHYAATDVLVVKTVDRTAADLGPGHGGVVNVGGRSLAVYIDAEGRSYELSPRCTHMGCTVGWNAVDLTWDCPCHGSRFGYDGSVLRGPATRPLERVGGDGPGLEAEPAPPPPRRRSAGRRFAIVGASLAGATAAAVLREEGFDGEVILVGAEPAFPYERPPLSKSFLRGESRLEDAFVQPPGFYEEQGIELLTGTTVTRVDPRERKIEVAGGDPIPCDALLIATGARPRRARIPGASLEGVYALRSAADAAALRAELVPGRRAVLAGMGFIGSEAAASLRARGLEVHVVDGNGAPLARVLGPEVGGVLAAIHRDRGVVMTFHDRLERIEGDGRARRVVTAGGLAIDCDLVLLGLGVEPATGFLAGSGILVDDGVLVDERCRTNVEGVFAAGDVARHRHPLFGPIRVEHWQNARAQGRAAALSMLGRGEPYAEVHWFWSEQHDHRLEYGGWHVGWDELVVRGSLVERRFAVFYLAEGRVRAVAGLDRADDVRAAMALIAAGGRADPESLRDEDVDLARLAPAG